MFFKIKWKFSNRTNKPEAGWYIAKSQCVCVGGIVEMEWDLRVVGYKISFLVCGSGKLGETGHGI